MAARSLFLGRLQGCCAWNSICKLTILVVGVFCFYFLPPFFLSYRILKLELFGSGYSEYMKVTFLSLSILLLLEIGVYTWTHLSFPSIIYAICYNYVFI